MLKRIEQPNIQEPDNELPHIKARRLVRFLSRKTEAVNKLISKSFHPYVHWETIKYWQVPQGISNLELWKLIKFLRTGSNSVTSVVTNERSENFTWTRALPNLEQFLHEVDMKLGRNPFFSTNHTQDQDELQNRFLSRGIMEEAIASSQLEGAHTSRKAAKQILLEQRKPQNNSEQMIVNNYTVMRLIESDLKNKKLDEELLFLLHRTLTKDTLPQSEIGRYRTDQDDIVVSDHGQKGEIYHIPPKAAFLQKEITKLIAYANNELLDTAFVHPVIKAIIIHFWLGFLHPFTDGNGRIARAIFYWYLLKEGYWFFGLLPLSVAIKNSPAQYRDAYIYTEQDDNDLTYFIDYNINKITQAMRDFDKYAEKKWQENAQMVKIAINKYQLNERQIQLLRYYYKNKDITTSITTHTKVYGTSRITAMKDLRGLQKHGFLKPKKVGRNVYFYATSKITALFD